MPEGIRRPPRSHIAARVADWGTPAFSFVRILRSAVKFTRMRSIRLRGAPDFCGGVVFLEGYAQLCHSCPPILQLHGVEEEVLPSGIRTCTRDFPRPATHAMMARRYPPSGSFEHSRPTTKKGPSLSRCMILICTSASGRLLKLANRSTNESVIAATGPNCCCAFSPPKVGWSEARRQRPSPKSETLHPNPRLE